VLALALPIGADWYAVEAGRVREVVTAPALTPLPNDLGATLGLFNLRGEIVPLFDTGRLLGISLAGAGGYAVVVETVLGPAGLVTTGLPVAAHFEDPVGTGEGRATAAVYRLGTTVATLLDVEVLLAPARVLGAS
jgi:chemotaxis signal transduction protein